MNKPLIKRRCAVYTRKSTEEGLEMAFNTLDAQREACEAYIASQKPEGWVLVPDRYDDGGFSGANLERPGLKRLLADIEENRVDVVVVYKIDRLSRSLMDFAKLVEVFDRHGVTFVSVTQSFNTTTSMGRLTLNILLSFAQFEREVIGERIRDKIAASRRKGMWMGGNPPLGYDVRNRKLVVNKTEATRVRSIFERFLKVGSATVLARELADEGMTTKRGRLVNKGYLYKLLNNRVYIGLAIHKGTAYPGEHEAIIGRDLWDKVHAIMKESPRTRAANTRAQTPALLKGLVFGADGRAMTPTHTRKRGKLYRYYVAAGLLKGEAPPGAVKRFPAGEIEAAVIDQVRRLLVTPEAIVATWKAVREQEGGGKFREMTQDTPYAGDGGADASGVVGRDDGSTGHRARDRGNGVAADNVGEQDDMITEDDVREALTNLHPLWDELFPAEQARVLQLLVERVEVHEDGLDIRLRVDGLRTLVADLRGQQEKRRAA